MNPLNNLAARWPALDALLDEALALPVAERARWLESLAGEQAELKDTLSELLAAHAGVETGDFLGTLPKLARMGAAHAADTEPTAGDTIGAYRLISELGRGGMGAVWLAERADGQIKRQVALKLPRLAWGGALAERLARERDILATLAHPNIARLYDAGVDQHGRPYLAMEYVDGRPIDVYCREQVLPLRERLGLLLQVAAAVAHAHSRLVVHRDLKPNNILVTAEGQVRLLDFGIAKLMEGDRTEETSLTKLSGRALTPDYASPEQIRGEPLGTASDVYSLAVVAYELLAGERPYRLRRASAAELEEAIASIDPLLASAVAVGDPVLRKQIKGDLDAILNKALKKDMRQRYASVEAFAQDLQRHLDQQPVLAQPDRFSYRAGKFIRRHGPQVAAGGVVALALVAGAGVALWQAGQAREQATRAEEVKRFVLSIFNSADTGAGGNRQTTAVDLLKRAHEHLAKLPVTDAAIRVELLKAIGDSLIGQGEYQRALGVLEEATQLAMARLGAEHADTLAAQLALGEVLLETDQLARAGLPLDAAERGMRRSGNAAGLIGALRWKAILRTYEDRFDEAVALATEAVQLSETRLAATDKRALMLARHTLATTLISAKRGGRIEAAKRAYDLARELDGERQTVDVLNGRSVYAYALVAEGDVRQGASELKALLQQQIKLLGPDHGDVERTLGRLGNASLSLGDSTTAIDSFREGLRIQLAMDGERPSADAGRFSMALGRALADARRDGEAEAELRRANVIFASTLEPDHYEARRAQAITGHVLTRAGRLDEAEAVFACLLARPFSRPDEEAMIKLRLGVLRSSQGQHTEAQALLADALSIFGKEPVSTPYATVFAALGETQVQQGQASLALATLTQARTLFEQLQPTVSPDRADLLVSLARAQLALHHTDEAAVAAEQAVAFWRSFSPTHRSAGVALLWHARTLNAAGNTQGAGDVLRQAQAILETGGLPAERTLLQQTQREINAK